jgi:hypothetical protein
MPGCLHFWPTGSQWGGESRLSGSAFSLRGRTSAGRSRSGFEAGLSQHGADGGFAGEADLFGGDFAILPSRPISTKAGYA